MSTVDINTKKTERQTICSRHRDVIRFAHALGSVYHPDSQLHSVLERVICSLLGIKRARSAAHWHRATEKLMIHLGHGQDEYLALFWLPWFGVIEQRKNF